jgi:NAD-dependent deacetylase
VLIASIDKAVDILREASGVVALTGAGVSAESGLPTFRGKDGLWKNYRAEDIATPESFAANPKLVWEWYNWRRGLFKSCPPNPAHEALARLENAPFDFTLVTQNIDGLHSLAGSRSLLEVHGNIWRIRCDSCGYVEHNETVPLPEPPYCDCGSPLRPDVVWFGESLDSQILSAVMEALARTDVMIVAGTSSVVYPAASFAAYAKQAGALVVEVNLEPTPLTSWADVSIQGRAGEILPQIVRGVL